MTFNPRHAARTQTARLPPAGAAPLRFSLRRAAEYQGVRRRLNALFSAVWMICIGVSAFSAEPKTSASAPGQPPCPSNPLRMSADITQPILEKKVEVPTLSAEARRRFRGGTGIYEATITEKGEVCGFTVLREPKFEPPWPEAVEQHRKAIEQWRYKPATRKGKPVAVRFTISVTADFH